MESIVSVKAASSLRALLNLAPATARRLDQISTNSPHPAESHLLHEAAANSPTPDPSQEGNEPPRVAPRLGAAGGGFSDPMREIISEASHPAGNHPLPIGWGEGRGEGRVNQFPQAAEIEVPVSKLRLNDLVVLRPGDRVPTDAVVVEGNSAVDESMLTGESLPIDKAPGAKLYAGTVNQNGRLVMRVDATGEATALAQIIAVVQHAQTSRANIQKLGDQVSSVFVPIVVLIALGTGLWWGLAYDSARNVSQTLAPFLWKVHLPETALAAAFIQVAAVLIVACPCAMGLATPVAIMAGTNVAARRGILIRDGVALEKTGRLTAVLFDKTGTLTQGKLEVAKVEDCRNESEQIVSIQQLAAALARSSNHPLSKAVAKLAGAEIALIDWQEVRGAGVQATTPSKESKAILRLGSLNWLRGCKVELSAATRFVNEWSAQGATILGLATDARLIGLLALRDAIKPHAAEVVAQLAHQGKTTYLITGDNKLTAAAIAQQVGIPAENVFSEIRPEQKAEIVKQLQQRGERVAFVGDGINDAPALEQADLGIAVSQASDVAREAADIILLKSEIQAIPEALGLAQATLRTIKQNLFWAFFYNAAAIPLAVLGFLSPVLCAAAMGLSDLIVIGNALRLRRRKI
ncbi:MAG: heavy metal translocating P-type ATPase [Verrucomicrobia bacterium]|nr:heavy metal translocating P-type ATPase [Verrucomicrobiota bacterium]